MKTFHRGFSIAVNHDDLETRDAINSLKNLYSQVPKTKCEQCPGKKTVEADCCKTFSPPMLLVEFVNILNAFDEKTEEEKSKLYYECFKSFLNHEYIKPCPLLDDNNLCSVYEYRPFSCRMFGQYDPKEWEERLKNVSLEMGVPKEEVPFYEQCDGISIKKKQKHRNITKEKADSVFEKIHRLDAQLFPKEFRLQALEVAMGSYTYMTFDAHYLLMLVGQEELDGLASIKMQLRNLKDRDPTGFIELKKNIEDLLKNIKEEVAKCQK